MKAWLIETSNKYSTIIISAIFLILLSLIVYTFSKSKFEQTTIPTTDPESEIQIIDVEMKSPKASKNRIESVTASSTYKQESYSFEADNAVDNDIKSAWIEGVDGYGKDEWLQINFDKEVSLSEFYIFAGYESQTSDLVRNNRIKNIKITLGDSFEKEFELKDILDAQKINLGEAIISDYLKLSIIEVYEGKDNDTAISDIRFSDAEVISEYVNPEVITTSKSKTSRKITSNPAFYDVEFELEDGWNDEDTITKDNLSWNLAINPEYTGGGDGTDRNVYETSSTESGATITLKDGTQIYSTSHFCKIDISKENDACTSTFGTDNNDGEEIWFTTSLQSEQEEFGYPLIYSYQIDLPYNNYAVAHYYSYSHKVRHGEQSAYGLIKNSDKLNELLEEMYAMTGSIEITEYEPSYSCEVTEQISQLPELNNTDYCFYQKNYPEYDIPEQINIYSNGYTIQIFSKPDDITNEMCEAVEKGYGSVINNDKYCLSTYPNLSRSYELTLGGHFKNNLNQNLQINVWHPDLAKVASNRKIYEELDKIQMVEKLLNEIEVEF